MAGSAQKKRLALDTNVLLDLAEPKDFAHEFRETFQNKDYSLFIAPTVVAELDALSLYGTAKQRRCGNLALGKLLSWGIKAFDLSSIAEHLAEQFAQRVIAAGLIPAEEMNDALILGQTSSAEIPLLVTSDKHLLNIDETHLKAAFDDA